MTNPADEAGEASMAILKSLVRRRRRDEVADRGTWHGLSEIVGGMRIPRAAARKALNALAERGEIERFDYSNGIAYGAPLTPSPRTTP